MESGDTCCKVALSRCKDDYGPSMYNYIPSNAVPIIRDVGHGKGQPGSSVIKPL